MSSTNDISHYIIQCTQEICNQIVYSHNSQEGDKAKSNPAQLFLKTFQTNLATAINIVYFNEDGKENNAAGMEPNKDDIDFEKAVLDVISKRRQGTKFCKDVLEKTLSINSKTLMALEVDPKAVSVEKFGKPPAPCKKEELKLGARKTAEYLKNTVKYVSELNDRTEELVRAAVVYKDLDESICHENHLV